MNTTDFLSKANQATLRDLYAEGLKQSWGKDTRMIDFCLKQCTVFAPVPGGVIALEKPSIDKEFYFGYSDCGQGRSYEDNNELMTDVAENLAEYFMNYNLRKVNEDIEICEAILKDEEYSFRTYNCYCGIHYYSAPDDCPCKYYCFRPLVDELDCRLDKDLIKLSKDDVKYILEALKLNRDMFVKRLNSYLKKYGTSKLRIDSYWIDR